MMSDVKQGPLKNQETLILPSTHKVANKIAAKVFEMRIYRLIYRRRSLQIYFNLERAKIQRTREHAQIQRTLFIVNRGNVYSGHFLS